jgi:hypothetical protein
VVVHHAVGAGLDGAVGWKPTLRGGALRVRASFPQVGVDSGGELAYEARLARRCSGAGGRGGPYQSGVWWPFTGPMCPPDLGRIHD